MKKTSFRKAILFIAAGILLVVAGIFYSIFHHAPLWPATVSTALPDATTWDVLIADTQYNRKKGLMEHTELPSDEGMLFAYPAQQSTDNAFWMYNTKIPLDIAFLNDAGIVVSMTSMQPCESDDPDDCREYTSDSPYWYALEVNAGGLSRARVEVGDTLHLPSELTTLN